MFVALLAAAAVAAPAECPPTLDGKVPPSGEADWLIKPEPKDMWWAYPPKAVEEELPGRATIRCEVTVDGVPENCDVISEEPRGYGFGEAGVSMTSRMRFMPKLRCGVAVRGTVRIPLNFSVPEAEETWRVPNAANPNDPRAVLARRLAEAMGVPASLDAGLEREAITAVKSKIEGRDPTADERKAIYQAYTENAFVLHEKMLGSVIETLARTLTEAELSQAIAFYETPLGARFGWDRELSQQVGQAIKTMRPDPYAPLKLRFCELSPSSCPKPASR